MELVLVSTPTHRAFVRFVVGDVIPTIEAQLMAACQLFKSFLLKAYRTLSDFICIPNGA